jgi:hypothetical protein
MKHFFLFVTVLLAATFLGCQDSKNPGQTLSEIVPTSSSVQGTQAPETPNFNLEVILRDISGGSGFGLVKFRQPNDDQFVVNLDTWVRDLAPNTSYRLQRAVDTTLDRVCTSTAWLTLGKGLTPQAITTDATGSAREDLWRAVPATPGVTFDIHFQVIEDISGAVVLQSDCYQYTVSQ